LRGASRENVRNERGSFAKRKLTRAQSAEVLGRLGHDVGAQLHGDAAERGAAGGDVEEHAGVGHFGWRLFFLVLGRSERDALRRLRESGQVERFVCEEGEEEAEGARV
jgi:hypothetical protein